MFAVALSGLSSRVFGYMAGIGDGACPADSSSVKGWLNVLFSLDSGILYVIPNALLGIFLCYEQALSE